ncbi:Acryloyl-coenzyme A reductase [Thermoplasmatales archaeon]|nr:Acryloyl-coenzyme A reductase [Thermoplasmatales archaeon]
MKTAYLDELRHPLRIAESEIDDPVGDEIILKQSVTGVCFRDILTMDGFFPRVKLPIIPGHEIAGEIVKIGPDVKKFRIGERVASLIYIPCGKCEFCLTGRENLCPNKKTFGELLDGSYRKFVKVSERSVVHVPNGVGDHEAAISACVTGMIYHAIKVEAGIKEGETILITGSGGGVGIHAIQIAKALGATVIAETSSKWKAEQIISAGADHVVYSGDDLGRKTKELSGGGVDVVLESVGKPTFDGALRSLKTGGRMVVIGNVIPDPVNLPLGLIILKGNRIMGSISSTRDDMKKALDLSASGKVKAVSNMEIQLEAINTAYEDIRNRKNVGRVMIKLDG